MTRLMTRFFSPHRPFVAICLAASVIGAGGAVAQTAPKKPVTNQNPIEVITNFKLRADPVEPMDFVKKSRPPEEQLQYLPITASKPEPEKRVMSFEEIKAKELELDGVRVRHDRIGGRAAPKTPLKTVAYAPKPPAVKKKQSCLITCTVEPRPVRDR